MERPVLLNNANNNANEFKSMKTLLKKSLLTSLYQREEQPPLSPFDKGECPSLAKRGEGRFTEGNCPLTYELLSKKGFTLVEVLISLVVLLLVSLALMQTALVSIDSNMINVLRDEAVGIAEMRMDGARNTAFDSLASDSILLPAGVDCPATFKDGSANGQRIQRNIRNVSNKDFCTRMAVTGSGDTRQVNVEVRWKWKDVDYSHRITSIVRRQ